MQISYSLWPYNNMIYERNTWEKTAAFLMERVVTINMIILLPPLAVVFKNHTANM